MTAPFSITASTVGTPSEGPGWITAMASSFEVGTSPSRQLTMSDLVPSRNLPIFESDGLIVGMPDSHVQRIRPGLLHESDRRCTIWSIVNSHSSQMTTFTLLVTCPVQVDD